jgi:hypothetical protein
VSRKFLDTDHPMFRPLWVRVLIVALCLGWAAFEFVDGSPFWGVLFGGLGVYAAWGFFVAARPGGGDGPQQ